MVLRSRASGRFWCDQIGFDWKSGRVWISGTGSTSDAVRTHRPAV